MSKYTHLFFSPKGRLRRVDNIIATIILGILNAIVFTLVRYVKDPEQYFLSLGMSLEHAHYLMASISIIILLFLLVSMYCGWIIAIKRWHDMDYVGWWVLTLLIPLLGILAWLYMLFYPGTKGPNRFGNPEKVFFSQGNFSG